MNCSSRSNYYILSVSTHAKLYFRLQKLLTDKRMCHGNNLCTLIHKHLYGPLGKEIHVPIYQGIFTYIPLVYRRYIFLYGQATKQICKNVLN